MAINPVSKQSDKARSTAMTAIDLAFGSSPKPDHFTNYTHCEECAEYDELLRNRTRETLSIQDLGKAGSDPIYFCSPEGMAFYMPSLARLAFIEPLHACGWYGERLLFHLHSGAAYNALFQYCNDEQRAAIAMLIGAMIESSAADIESSCSEEEFLQAHEIWSHAKT